jgi:hypothetical protein
MGSTVTPSVKAPEPRYRLRQNASRSHAFTATQAPSTCPTCRGPHNIWRCDSFKDKPVSERLKDVKRVSCCINCPRKVHSVRECKAGACRRCGQWHHTMLHGAKHHSRSRSITSNQASSPSSSRSSTPHSTPSSSPTRHRKHTTARTITESTRSSGIHATVAREGVGWKIQLVL